MTEAKISGRELLKAVKSGDIALTERLLEGDVSIDVVNFHDDKVLRIAYCQMLIRFARVSRATRR